MRVTENGSLFHSRPGPADRCSTGITMMLLLLPCSPPLYGGFTPARDRPTAAATASAAPAGHVFHSRPGPADRCSFALPARARASLSKLFHSRPGPADRCSPRLCGAGIPGRRVSLPPGTGRPLQLRAHLNRIFRPPSFTPARDRPTAAAAPQRQGLKPLRPGITVPFPEDWSSARDTVQSSCSSALGEARPARHRPAGYRTLGGFRPRDGRQQCDDRRRSPFSQHSRR
jgi:hypothetical protein